MKISLDFDDTFTKDPAMWTKFIDLARKSGHTVYCVTMRYEHEGAPVEHYLRDVVDEIFYTGRMAKRRFMNDKGIWIDVWIDDNPNWILTSAAA